MESCHHFSVCVQTKCGIYRGSWGDSTSHKLY